MKIVQLKKPAHATKHAMMADKDAETIAEKLAIVLANNYALYMKTQAYHWNVTGASFFSLHNLFEEQYTALATVVDDVAERIRALGFLAQSGFKKYADLSSIDSSDGELSDANSMLQNLADDHAKIIKLWEETKELADQHGDESTSGLAAERLTWHEKAMWMLRSSIA